MSWYQQNKDKALQKQREYRKRNRQKILENRRRYDKENHDKQLQQKKQWRTTHPVKYKTQKKKDDHIYWMKHKDIPEFKEKEQKRHKKYQIENKEKIAAYVKTHQSIPKVRERRNELSRIRNRNNPRSNRSGTIEVQIAMNNVRKRDNQTCQWQGCNLTYKEAPIHVHHIFPTHEYPDYEEIEQYMICYCANHHGMFHRYRGDKYANFIGANTELLRSRD